MISREEFKERSSALVKELEARQIDSFFVTNETNVSYLSGFMGHDSMLLITRSGRFFITDSRYAVEAASSVVGFDIEVVTKSVYDTLTKLRDENGLKRIGFESMNIPYGVVGRFKEKVPDAEFVPMTNLVEGLRSIKSPGEVKMLMRSIDAAREVLKNISRKIRPGMTERYLAGLIDIEFIKRGGRSAFSPIVAAGKNSAMPHARPADKKIPANTFVMLDIGCNLGGYNSDITRIITFGRMTAKLKKIRAVVYGAQARAIRMVKPGAKISDIDDAGRNFIEKEGFGKFFGHALGHGVGMDVHEEPTISRRTKGILMPGEVFTIEPAIYIPGFGGVRIEDMVLVTDNGCRVLTL